MKSVFGRVAAVAWPCLSAALLAAPLAGWATPVGTTAGSFSVSPSGAATYSIPITVPPGTAGLEPKLSIQYSSQSQNGMLGVGFSLGGLSSISRCPASQATDGYVDGIDLDGNDRLCLDGQKLVAVSGVYGASGTEYRTEIDVLSKIVGHGNINDADSWFEVFTKAGTTIQYGTWSSLQRAPGRNLILAWHMGTVIDAAGNYMVVHYQWDGATYEHFPVRIEYAGNGTAGILPYASIRFVYDTNRPDVQQSFLLGSAARYTRRLRGIQTWTTAVVRDYRLEYRQSGVGQLSQLHDVTECTATECLPPLNFERQALSNSPGTLVSQSIDSGNFGEEADFKTKLVADLNNDGLNDLIAISHWHTGLWAYVSMNQGNGSFGPVAPHRLTAADLDPDLNGFTKFVGDANGDGIADLFAMNSGHAGSQYNQNTTGLQVWCALGRGDGTFNPGIRTVLSTADFGDSSAYTRAPADLDGDGRTDVVALYSGPSGLQVVAALSRGDGRFAPPTMSLVRNADFGAIPWWYYKYPTDINGDGLADLLAMYSGPLGFDVWTSLGTGNGTFLPAVQSPLSTAHFGSENLYEKLPVDVNGDGLLDVLALYTGPDGFDALTSLNRGDGRFAPLVGSNLNDRAMGVDPKTYSKQAGDINGDGLVDVVAFYTGDTGVQAFTSLGTGTGTFLPAVEHNLVTVENPPTGGWTLNPSPYANHQKNLVDMDGDGLADLVATYCGEDGFLNRLSLRLGTSHEHVTRITSGTGAEVTVEYRPLTDPSVYTPSSGSAYPVIDHRPPLTVVSDHHSSDGLGGTSHVEYAYAQSRLHLTGRGWLGFGQVTTTDYTSGIREVTKVRQDFPFVGLVKQETRTTTGGALLADTFTSYSSNSPTAVSRFVYASGVEARAYELTTGSRISTTKTSNWYGDLYGNLTWSSVETFAGAPTGVPHKTTVVNTFDQEDPARWHLGRLTRTTVTREGPQIQAMTRTSAFEYDSYYGWLTAEIIEPDDAGLMLRTTYAKDVLGNTISKTVLGAGMVPRLTTFEYDQSYPNYGRFNTRIVNALGHAETRTFHPSTGAVTSTTSANSLVTTYTQDAWGRPFREAFAQHGINTWTQTERKWCAESPGCRSGETFFVRTTSATGAENVVFFDLLERERRRLTKLGDGQFSAINTEYDAAGRVKQASSPYLSTGTPVFWTTSDYDAAGRLWRTTAPADQNSPTGCVTRLAYRGLETSHYDCLNRETVRRVNELGNLMSVRDARGGEAYYWYDAFDNLTWMQDAGGAATSLSYDRRGRKTYMKDPNMGEWSYAYSSVGELIWQKDARGVVVESVYDQLGRIALRVEPEGTTEWFYDQKWKGALDSVTSPSYRRVLNYKPHGALSYEEITIAGTAYRTIGYGYDSFGRLAGTWYPSGLVVRNRYNASGAMDCVYPDGGACYWQANEWDHWGKVTLSTLGSGVQTMKSFDSAVGNLDAIVSGLGGSDDVQSLNYTWDAVRNLKTREDQNQGGLRETFTYDALNRVTWGNLTGSFGNSESFSATYQPNGNLSWRNGLGTYSYAGGKPHAASKIGSFDLIYDANGNLLTGGGISGNRTIAWNSFNLPITIHDGAASSQFLYGPEHQRVLQITTPAKLATRFIYYFGAGYEEHVEGQLTLQKHHVVTPEGTVAVDTRINGVGSHVVYLHYDHLGSVDTITDSSGAFVDRFSYDAFGKRRGMNWQGVGTGSAWTRRGYTSHEHLDDTGLIHMNGRLYDPLLGRFVSADPLITEPANTQGLNRYSYVGNNPLTLTDPSGFSWFSDQTRRVGHEVRRWERSFRAEMRRPDSYLGAAIQGIGTGLSSYCGWAAPACAAAINGAVAGAQGARSSDVWRAAATGAVMSYSFGQIGAAYKLGTINGIERVVYSGFVGGVVSEANGGEFGTGFLSASFSTAAIPYIPDHPVFGRIAAALIGGAAAELGGGKFANGAVTGAFAYAFGRMAQEARARGTTADGTSTDTEEGGRGSGWLRPKDHPYVVGREGSDIVYPGPAGGLGRFLDDYGPAWHTFGTNHDAFVGWINPNDYLVVDLVVNVPSMFVMYPLAVVQELFNTPVYLMNTFSTTPRPAPLDHSHPRRP